MKRRRVLIVCTGNSCRSHMAEGILRQMGSDLFEVFSAGTEPAGYVHPRAIEAMKEIGIDLAGHTSSAIGPYLDGEIDVMITVCDGANKACPALPEKVRRYHWSFEDPASFEGSEEEILGRFREVRDQIRRTFGAYVEGCREARDAGCGSA